MRPLDLTNQNSVKNEKKLVGPDSTSLPATSILNCCISVAERWIMYKGAQHTLDARMACRRCSAVMLFLSFAMCFETASSFRNTAANFDFLIGRSPRCRSLALTAWAPPAWQKGRRVARFTPLAMSEIAEDYPSDTGDDRFSSGGERSEDIWVQLC